MKKSILLHFSLIALLISYNIKTSDIVKEKIEKPVHLTSMVVIELVEHQGIRILGEKIKKEIDRIIIEEFDKIIEHNTAIKYPTSGVRAKLVLSLYYIGNVEPIHEMALINALQLMQNLQRGIGPVGPLEITNDFDFFGTNDEIAVKINDTSGSLKKLRQDVKDALFSLNEYYRKDPRIKTDLFPLSEGDKYQFVPHITFSRIPCKAIDKLAQELGINDPNLCQKIKNRVCNETFPFLSLPKENKQVTVSAFQLWSHISLKNFPLTSCK